MSAFSVPAMCTPTCARKIDPHFVPLRSEQKLIISPTPTRLIGGDVDRGELRRVRALVGHAVDRLDLEAVLRVGLEVAHGHAALGQPQVARRDVHVVVAPRAHAALGQALLADDVVEDVVAAAQVARVAPLQHQRGLVHAGDDVARRRGNGCGGEGEKRVSGMSEKFIRTRNAGSKIASKSEQRRGSRHNMFRNIYYCNSCMTMFGWRCGVGTWFSCIYKNLPPRPSPHYRKKNSSAAGNERD